jgi:2-oxoglutarate ferredoxin oxidoreductase subunit beta
VEAVHADFVPLQREITVPETDEEVRVVQMHDGATCACVHRGRLRSHQPRVGLRACARLPGASRNRDGVLFVDEGGRDMHDMMRTVPTPLIDVPYEKLCPGKAALDALMERPLVRFPRTVLPPRRYQLRIARVSARSSALANACFSRAP